MFACLSSNTAKSKLLQTSHLSHPYNPQQKDYHRIARARLQSDHIRYFKNDSQTHVLCILDTVSGLQDQQNRATVTFLIYDIFSKKVIFEDSIKSGSVSWLDDSHIRVTKHIHNSKTDAFDFRPDADYLFHIFGNAKLSISENQLGLTSQH